MLRGRIVNRAVGNRNEAISNQGHDVSNINKVLVKDRVSYALHNLREIMIM